MRAILVNVSEALIEERHRKGIDRQDERWNGEWHLVNPPRLWHPRVNSDMYEVLAPLARRRGLVPYCESTGVFGEQRDRDWRIPDQVYARPDHELDEGLTGAELVVEVRSPGDDSYLKLPFYASRGIPEALIVHRDRRVELFRLAGAGGYRPAEDSASTVLGVAFTTVVGPLLRIAWEDGAAEV